LKPRKIQDCGAFLFFVSAVPRYSYSKKLCILYTLASDTKKLYEVLFNAMNNKERHHLWWQPQVAVGR
jgi:hypothetical protein